VAVSQAPEVSVSGFYGNDYDEEGNLIEEPDQTEEEHRSQLRMSERLAASHKDRLRFAHGLGWLVWDGTRWARDEDGASMRAAVEVVKRARREAKKETDKELADDAKNSETASSLGGILRIASNLKPIAIAARELDSDPFLFNVANGTLDLRTGTVRSASPRDLITKVAGCGYYPDAAGPVFEKFLGEVLPVESVRLFVQRIAGYALLGKVTEHLLPIFTGTGCNGKTTLIELLLKVFGDYGIMADPELFIEHAFGQHPTGQSDLQGVRLAVTQETDAGRPLAVATVKRLTGGDKIRARRMRMDFFEFDPSHTAVMVTNHRPRVPGDDPALWRRIHIVPFDVKVAAPDSSLPDRLALELPAVLAWTIAGYREYTEHGLGVPEIVTKRTGEYRIFSDALGRFLDEKTVTHQMSRAQARPLFTAWQEWCKAVGEEPGSEVDFSQAMSDRGFPKRKSHGIQTYFGLGLAADSSHTPDSPPSSPDPHIPEDIEPGGRVGEGFDYDENSAGGRPAGSIGAEMNRPPRCRVCTQPALPGSQYCQRHGARPGRQQ
jgi:putative DNA primase/helicase